MKKRTFNIIKSTVHKNNKNAFWLLVSISGQSFVVQTPDWETECIEIDWKTNTLTLIGDIERVKNDKIDTETGEILKEGTKLCPKLDF